MRVEQICSKDVITVGPNDPISRVSMLMRENHVGTVVVQDQGYPVGIVTDRDIAVRAGARREALADIHVSDIMSRRVVTISTDDDIADALQQMREAGVRRLPVLNEGGYLAGVVSFDDIFQHLARMMKTAAEIVQMELGHESRAKEFEERETEAERATPT